MVARSSRLNLRVQDDLLTILEEIGIRNGMQSVSEAARAALDRYVEEEADAWNSDIVSTKIPRGTMDALETLIMAGDATDVQQAINFALNEWVASKTKYHLEGRDALREKVGEVIEERATKERLKSAAKEMSKR